MKNKRTYVIGLLLALLLLVACAPSGAEPGAGQDPTEAPVEEPTEMPEPTDEAETPDETETPDGAGGGEAADSDAALQAALEALAQEVGLSVDDIQVESVEETEWPNACLGLPEDDEVCAEVITPGYLVILNAGDRVYEVRTDAQGDIVRYLETADPGAEQPVAAVRAREFLAEDLGLDLENVEVVSFERREWSDSCLGLGGPAESCLQAITPGWLVMLSVDGEPYEVRTDAEGSVVRIANKVQVGEGAAEDQPIIVLSQSGGIAGQVIEWRIYADGRVEKVEDAQRPDAESVEGNVHTAQVEPEQIDGLVTDLEELGYFELDSNYIPKDTCCDRFMYNLTVQTTDRMHAIAAMDGTEDVPEEVWESINLVQTFVDERVTTE
jgi:hypothetical protein